ncbi:MAG: hypothetical protein JWQ99_78 [Blastococcus sp.]|nr:hypothetical protein [Blastococcus sp.]
MTTEQEPVDRPPRWQRWATVAWPGRPDRWRDVPGRLRPTLVTVTRLTVAAVVSYLITLQVTEGAIDLTGALTALLVVQASAFSTVKMGAVRVGAVLSGVLVASLLSSWVGLTWWSLGAAIAASLVLGKVLRLGDQALETPITAMLILGVTNHDIAAEVRILNTLIGAGVGVAMNLIYPPAMPTASAGRSLLRVVEAAATPLDSAADALAAGPVTRAQVASWLDRLRSATRRVAYAREIIDALKDSRRFNPRALGTIDVEPVLGTGLDTLEHCLLDIRGLLTVISAEIPAEERPDDPYGEELRAAFAVVLHDAADCLRAFGSLVVAEAEQREHETEEALAESLEILRETQAILTELIMVRVQDNPSAWLLRGSILAALRQVLARLDLEDRARLHRALKEEQLRRPMAQLPPLIQGVLPHPDRPYLRGLPPPKVWRSRR